MLPDQDVGTAALGALGNTDEAATERPVGRLAFPVADCGVLFEAPLPAEYIEDPAIFSIPTAHSLFRGLINRRGALVPVFDIRTLVNPAWESTTGALKILVLGDGDDAVGIVLDGTPYRVYLTVGSQIQPPPRLAQAFSRYAEQCFHHHDTDYVSVHLDEFLYTLQSQTASS